MLITATANIIIISATLLRLYESYNHHNHH